jgi:hypothetical protein
VAPFVPTPSTALLQRPDELFRHRLLVDSACRLKRIPASFCICSFKTPYDCSVGRLPVHPCSMAGPTPEGAREPIGHDITDRKLCRMTSSCGCRRTIPGAVNRDAGRISLPPRRPPDWPIAHENSRPRGFRRCRPAHTWTASAMLGNDALACVLGVRRSGRGGLGRRRACHPAAYHCAILRSMRATGRRTVTRGLARASPDWPVIFIDHHSPVAFTV